MGAVTSALGVTPMDIKRFGEGLADGAFIPGVSFFVGGAARKTWAAMWDDAKTRYTSGNIGDVFSGFEYKSNLAKDPTGKGYDKAYGESDYSALINAQATTDADTLAAEGDLPAGVPRTEPNAGKTEDTLKEVYGDTDSASFGSQSEPPATIEEVYGSTGTIKKTRPSAEERAKMIEEAYNGDAPPNDTDTSGITASDADGAPIDPVV